MKATITYHVNSQKIIGYYKQVLSDSILEDICLRVTGQRSYVRNEIQDGYNKGRLIIVEYGNSKFYVTLSEIKIGGRNSSMQSVPTALNIYFQDIYPNKSLSYYFMPNIIGNAYTDYHIAYYKLLSTAGVNFLNFCTAYDLSPYSSIEELILDRDSNRNANRSNNSSYVTKDLGRVQVYAKTYGASKYESTLLGIAASKLVGKNSPKIQLYNINERDLKRLPNSSIKTLEALGNIEILDTNYTMEKNKFIEGGFQSLRSPIYAYHLLQRLGHKHCAFCGCEIPDIIQGAHIWGISQIKESALSIEDKFNHAVNGHNGLWLCSNHHKLFDSNILQLDSYGNINVRSEIPASDKDFIRDITTFKRISQEILSPEFIGYVNMRNSSIPNWQYCSLSM